MQRAADFATIVAAIVAAGALLIGLSQFKETQALTRKNLELQADALRVQAEALQHERDMKAVELFLKFNDQQQEFANKPTPRKSDSAFWKYNAILGETEALFRLTKGDPGWDETITWMLEVQQPFLLQTKFKCNTFDEDFLVRMKKAEPTINCP